MKATRLIIFAVILFLAPASANAQKMTENRQTKITIQFSKKDFPIGEFDNKAWEKAQEISIEKYWSGEDAPVGRHAEARLLWSDAALCGLRLLLLSGQCTIISSFSSSKIKNEKL